MKKRLKHKLFVKFSKGCNRVTQCQNCRDVFHYYEKDLKKLAKKYNLAYPPSKDNYNTFFKSQFKLVKQHHGENYYSFRLDVMRKNGKHYLVNPFTGKILTKIDCEISGTDKIIKDIL